MSQPSLLDLPQTKVIAKVVPTSLCDRLAAYFIARPNVWIDGMDLARIAGQYAWRSRVSDLRKRGMVIENRQRACDHVGIVSDEPIFTFTISEYRYVPEGQ